ncbi:MAG: hypothetical protein EA415_02510 [Sphaerobacteraceae bacterium]|nr:MAG: hypothetical protein EA415_02510 [Sphaerobacteraceae bacterium]
MNQKYQAHEGQILVLFAIGTIILIAFAALAVDVGLALSERRGAQNAADAATLAVARAMVEGETNDAVLRQTALHYAQANGYDIADLDADIQLTETGVEVNVRHDVTRAFLGAFYDGDWAISADARASLDTVPADYGLIALDDSGDAIYLAGNTHVRVQGGGMMSNSGIACGGSSTITAGTAVHAAGSVLDTTNPSIACIIEGDENTSGNRSPIEDPLAGTPTPPEPSYPTGLPAGQCTYEDQQWNSRAVCQPGHYTSWNWGSGWGIRLMPGTYLFDTNVTTNPYGTGVIDMVPGGNYTFYVRNSTFSVNNTTWDMGSNNVNMYFLNSSFQFTGGTDLVTLGSGLYYFDNSRFEPASGANARGDAVSFFFRNGGEFKTSGNTQQMRFTAPTTSLYGEPPNTLFHAEPGSNTNIHFGNSSPNVLLQGLVYAPDSDFLMSGNTSGVWAQGQLIVRTFRAPSGSLGTAGNPSTIEYVDYVDMGTPQVWLTR